MVTMATRGPTGVGKCVPASFLLWGLHAQVLARSCPSQTSSSLWMQPSGFLHLRFRPLENKISPVVKSIPFKTNRGRKKRHFTQWKVSGSHKIGTSIPTPLTARRCGGECLRENRRQCPESASAEILRFGPVSSLQSPRVDLK